MKLTSQFNQQRHLQHKKCDKIFSSARANTVCNSISSLHGACLGCTASHGTKASQLVNIYTKLLESIELYINPSVVCARLYINEFASVMI